jgi:hypothetical protein
LRLAEVQATPADPLPERRQVVWATPWEHSRSGALEPQAGKRQRNGVRAAGSGTPSAAVAAGPAT